MKRAIVPVVIVALVGLFLLNRYLNETPSYIPGVPSAAEPATGEARQELAVGFLPVT